MFTFLPSWKEDNLESPQSLSPLTFTGTLPTQGFKEHLLQIETKEQGLKKGVIGEGLRKLEGREGYTKRMSNNYYDQFGWKNSANRIGVSIS